MDHAFSDCAAPGWTDHVSVADIDPVVATASQGGAQIKVPVTEIASVGRFALLVDPQGHVIAAIQYSAPAG